MIKEECIDINANVNEESVDIVKLVAFIDIVSTLPQHFDYYTRLSIDILKEILGWKKKYKIDLGELFLNWYFKYGNINDLSFKKCWIS